MQNIIYRFITILIILLVFIVPDSIVFAWGRRPPDLIKTESEGPIQPRIEIILPPKETIKKEEHNLSTAAPQQTDLPRNVLEIQTALKNAGYDPGPLDGKIGPQTKNATRQFQKEHELEIDGKAGKKTWYKLRNFLSIEKEGINEGS
ncbi:MAG: peptidoglycan-binding domain-containing protein [Candidatus Omnitrophota bacterium]